jgi:hypothetical protein
MAYKPSKQESVKLSADLVQVLKTGHTMAVLATFSEKGEPHATPVHFLYPKGDGSILLAIHKEHPSYHNMVWQKRVSLCFMDKGNISYSVIGRAGVVKAPAQSHPLMNIMRIDAIELINERSSVIKVDGAARWSSISPDADELVEAIMDELKEIVHLL